MGIISLSKGFFRGRPQLFAVHEDALCDVPQQRRGSALDAPFLPGPEETEEMAMG